MVLLFCMHSICQSLLQQTRGCFLHCKAADTARVLAKKALQNAFLGRLLLTPQSHPCSHHHQNQAQRLQASWGPKALCGGSWYRFPGLFLGKLRLADWSSSLGAGPRPVSQLLWDSL